MKTIAITGATGHLGGVVARELHARGYAVKALARSDDLRCLDGIPVTWIKGDLHDHTALQSCASGCDALIHCAAIISIDGGQQGAVHRVNVEGTRQVMEAARSAGIRRVIHVSSIHAYEQKPVHQILDETSARPSESRFAYDRSKLASQELALSYTQHGMEVLVVNPTSVMGPFDFKPSKLGRDIIEMATGKLPFVFTGGFDFCDVRDLAHAMVNGLDMGRSGETYLLGGRWHSLTELTEVLGEVIGKNIKPTSVPVLFAWAGLPFIRLQAMLTRTEPLYTNEALIAVTDGNRHISSAKAIAELGYTPRPLADTLKDTYHWFLQNGYLD